MGYPWISMFFIEENHMESTWMVAKLETPVENAGRKPFGKRLQIANWEITVFCRSINELNRPCSIAMLVYVSLLEGIISRVEGG